jgi:DNA-binding response OmpR family regulator
MPPAKVFIVEDEENIRFFLTNLLQDEGYQTQTATNGESAVAQLAAGQFDLAILDLNLGAGMDGMGVLAALNQQAVGTAVILLTGYATVETAITALRQGASDYLLKPSPAEQILASVRQALAKRQGEQQRQQLLSQLEQGLAGLRTIEQRMAAVPPASQTIETEKRLLRQGNLVIDLARHMVTVDDQLIETSPAEFDFLVYLVTQAPRVVPADEIIRQVYQYETGLLQDSEALRALVYRLRSKIKESTGRTDVIRTVRAVGYTVG